MMRPITSREEYLKLRNSAQQIATMRAIREGNVEQKRRLIQMNYSCMLVKCMTLCAEGLRQ